MGAEFLAGSPQLFTSFDGAGPQDVCVHKHVGGVCVCACVCKGAYVRAWCVYVCVYGMCIVWCVCVWYMCSVIYVCMCVWYVCSVHACVHAQFGCKTAIII